MKMNSNHTYYASIPDLEFIRGKVPMTKEEIRQISIGKMKLTKDAVVYDVGSGTGSVAVTIAGISDQIQVYAIERKPEAVDLIRQNCEKFGRRNVEIVEAEAPEGLSELPAPTHAFIGGSGGHLQEILTSLYQKNPAMQVVINAVSMETMQECMAIENHTQEYQVTDYSLVQVGVTRVREIGAHHMLQGENPVWICAFRFRQI